MGNGQGLKISQIGSSFLPSPQKKFQLKRHLHVPPIDKKLISVSQFTRDNLASIEFFPYYFSAKDLF